MPDGGLGAYPEPLLIGCDFSSRPTRVKPVVLALGSLKDGRVKLLKMERLASLEAFSQWLKRPGPWLGAFDFPFGLPRELVTQLGWPLQWAPCIRHFSGLSRAEIRSTFVAFCASRPVGSKFAHRATDRPAGSSPSMKWVNPPVAYMLHAGVPLLLQAQVHLPGLHAGGSASTAGEEGRRVALEGYPGLLAREILGRRSYKSDDKRKQDAVRLIVRKDLINALEQGQTRLELRLKLTHAQRDALVDDASGDALDAVLCLIQAAWAQSRHLEGIPTYGLPRGMDALEGWIVSAAPDTTPP